MSRPGVAVVGAAGYLGSTVCQSMAGEFTVRRLVRRPAGKRDERFDFWHDDPAHALADAEAVVFSARVHPVSEVDDHDAMREYEQRIRALARACSGRLLLVVSTDAVFSGDRGAYSEDETPQPSTAYGKCARIIEEVVAEYADRWCVVRPSYIYGFAPTGLDKRLAAAVDAVRGQTGFDVYSDMFRSPIAVDDLAAAIRELVRRDVRGVVHAGGPRLSVADFFSRALTTLGHPTDMLRPRRLPIDAGQPDTTLLTRRLLQETPVVPRSVADALSPVKQHVHEVSA